MPLTTATGDDAATVQLGRDRAKRGMAGHHDIGDDRREVRREALGTIEDRRHLCAVTLTGLNQRCCAIRIAQFCPPYLGCCQGLFGAP